MPTGMDVSTLLNILIANNADVNQQNTTLDTPLHDASWDGNVDIIRCLIANGANLNLETTAFHTPMHHAASRGHLEAVEVLLENRADPLIEDCKFKTAADLAREGKHHDVEQLILRHIQSCKNQEQPAQDANTMASMSPSNQQLSTTETTQKPTVEADRIIESHRFPPDPINQAQHANVMVTIQNSNQQSSTEKTQNEVIPSIEESHHFVQDTTDHPEFCAVASTNNQLYPIWSLLNSVRQDIQENKEMLTRSIMALSTLTVNGSDLCPHLIWIAPSDGAKF